MLRTRFIHLLQNDSPVLAPALSSSFQATRNFDRKYKRRRSCDPLPIAIILCGCGYLDGTEISEAISAAICISQKQMKPVFYAPDVELPDTVDHLTKKADKCSGTRNALVEAARLARSSIRPLCECEACMHGALIVPGGFGAAKALSDFAKKGADCTVLSDLEKLIDDFYCEEKPIGSMCIAGALIARVLKGVKITLGKESPKEDWPYGDVIQKVEDMGACVEMKGVKDVTHCEKYNVFSTPAWMYKPASYADVHAGIGKLISMLEKCITH